MPAECVLRRQADRMWGPTRSSLRRAGMLQPTHADRRSRIADRYPMHFAQFSILRVGSDNQTRNVRQFPDYAGTRTSATPSRDRSRNPYEGFLPEFGFRVLTA